MGKYQKRADKPVVVIPGVGAVANDRVLEGDFDRFVPGLLDRLPDEAPDPEVASQSPAVPEPEPETEPEPEPEPEPETEEEEVVEEEGEEEGEEEETPDHTWLKKDLIAYAESCDLVLAGHETKQELLDVINGAS